MLVTSEWVTILDETDVLSSMILSSEQAENLRIAYHKVYSDQILVQKIVNFTKMKEQYEDVQRFGKYHPDYNYIMKEIRKQKRELDLDERVARLKLAENDYQDLLDEVSLVFGKSVSESVKVPVSNPFFSTSSSCGSGCGSGGSCSCSA